MSMLLITQCVALAGLTAAAVGLILRWRETAGRPAPVDRAPAKGDPSRGMLYAFTLGMAPWTKESTRLHAAAYLRGVGFHVAIFAGLIAAAAVPFWTAIPPVVREVVAVTLGIGALLGVAGSIMRLREPHLRALSTADDHVSILLVTIFLAASGLALWQARFAPLMYLSAGVMLAYIPLGKIRHCMYFFFARGSFGRFAGRRGVLPHVTPVAGGSALPRIAPAAERSIR
jgi:nitrate reductase gamma subunit